MLHELFFITPALGWYVNADSGNTTVSVIPSPIATLNVVTPQKTAPSVISTPSTTAKSTALPVVTTPVKDVRFRVGPTIRLRPLNSNIDKDKDGIVELFLNNPILNDISLEVGISVSVPYGIYIYEEEGGMSGGAGTVVGHFSTPPGSSRTITFHIKGKEKGDFPVNFGGMYWPEGNKDAWNPISLSISFKVIEPSASIPTTTPK